MPQTMIVMPTYNEAENLPEIAAAIFALQIPDLQILVVDDGSPDGTGQIAEELREQYDGRVHVLHRPQKAGLGPAYVAGLSQALHMGMDYILQMDADFSHQPHYIPQMLEKLQQYDIVVGSRFIKGGGVDRSWSLYRKFLSLWANRIYTPAILRIPIHDATGGFRAWRRDTLIGVDLRRIQSNGYVFQVEMIYVAHRLGFRFAEVPIYFPDRVRGQSKMSSSVALEAAARVWEIRRRHRHLNQSQRATNLPPAPQTAGQQTS